MLGLQIKALMVSFLIHWLLTTGVVVVTWLGLDRMKKVPAFHLLSALVLSSGLSLWFSMNTLVGLSQTRSLIEAQSTQSQAGSANGAQGGAEIPKELQMLQMKAEFLRTVDLLSAQPAQITEDLKKQIFEKFAPLFPGGESDKKVYATKIARAYECQKLVIEDALTAKKSKKIIKSQEREGCEKEDGAFFNREKLISDEIKASNNVLIESASSDKNKGTDKEVSETALRSALEGQIRRYDAVKRIFE